MTGPRQLGDDLPPDKAAASGHENTHPPHSARPAGRWVVTWPSRWSEPARLTKTVRVAVAWGGFSSASLLIGKAPVAAVSVPSFGAADSVSTLCLRRSNRARPHPVRIVFTTNGWQDYTYWLSADRTTLKRINRLIDFLVELRRDGAVLRAGVRRPEGWIDELA
jgi:YoeB-like toxin of type II toxin-antitoxin system